jgi:hypothetical protein
MMGRWKKDGNHVPPNTKLVLEPEGNEENGYPDADSNKTKRNYTKECKNNLKEEILPAINENYIEIILDMVTQNI